MEPLSPTSAGLRERGVVHRYEQHHEREHRREIGRGPPGEQLCGEEEHLPSAARVDWTRRASILTAAHLVRTTIIMQNMRKYMERPLNG